MANLTIIDGHSYIYGAFYGVPDAAATRGKVRIDAVYGFFALLRVIVNEFPRNKVFIVFDSIKWAKGEMASRMSDADMKDLRSLIDQIEIVQKILTKINIKWVQHQTIKADNLIASLAEYWAKNEGSVQISSADFDFVQLISDKISLARNLHGLITKHDARFIREKFGIEPKQYVDYQSIVGDENDGFTGVRGIGPKTAAKLLKEHKNIAGIYAALADLPANISDKLRANKKLVLQNQKEIPMTRDVPLKEFMPTDLPTPDKKLVNQNINILLASIGIK